MKIILKRAMQFTALTIMTSIANADTSTTASLANELNAIHTYQANFSQVIYDNHNKALQSSQGKMALQRPGKFRWEITQPIPQLIIANGAKLWIYDADLQQVTIRAFTESAGDAPALFLSHPNADIEKNFIVKVLPNKAGVQWYSLTPKSGENNFSNIEMGFANNEIQAMNLKDQMGHITKIQFNHINLNTDLSAALFTFKVPANVDVIDETKKR